MNTMIRFPVEVREENEPLHNYSGHGWEGSEYRKHRFTSTTEIAAMIRKELRRFAKKEGIKISVRTKYFAGGSSIDVDVTSISFDPFTECYKEYLRSDRNFIHNCRHMYNPHMRWIFRRLKWTVNKYNFDDSESMIDYFSVNFYDHVGLNWELRRDLEKEYETV